MTNRAIWIRPLNLEGLLKEVLLSLEGGSVVILEGELQDLPHVDNLKCSVPVEFKSEAPGADIIALSLNKGDAMPLFHAIVITQGWSTKIQAMQVIKHGQRAFLAGDSFHGECVSVCPAASSELVDVLVSKHLASVL